MSTGEVTLTDETPSPSSDVETIVPAAAETETPAQVAEGDEAGATSDTPSAEFEAFTLPEGWIIEDNDLGTFKEIATNLNLDQAGAQQLVDMFVAIEGGRNDSLTEMQAQQDADRDAEWQEQLQNDPEIGGEKFEGARNNITALERSGVLHKEFSGWLRESGQFKNPAVIKQLSILGGFLQENPSAFGDATGATESGETPAQKMFAKSGHV
jgi:hypothetical protein